MIQSTSTISVRYSETDMMGIVYHANYLPWLEIGRTDLLRKNDLPYAELEKEGYLLPVLEVSVKYRRPARYDDLLTVNTLISEMPVIRIQIAYEVLRGEELLATASSSHAFMNRQGQPLKPPPHFRDAMAALFSKQDS